MVTSISNTEQLKRRVEELMKDTKGAHIESIMSDSCSWSHGGRAIADDDVYINLSNGKTIVFTYCHIEGLNISYCDTIASFYTKRFELFNCDEKTDRGTVYYSRLAYGCLCDIKVLEEKIEYTSETEENYYEEELAKVELVMDNGISVFISHVENYCEVSSPWTYRTEKRIPIQKATIKIKTIPEEKKPIVGKFIDYIDDLGCGPKLTTLFFAMCETLENIEQLVKYVEFKEPYYTAGDLLKYVTSLERSRFQSLPYNKYVRWIKETTLDFVQGEDYLVLTIYNKEKNRYKVLNERDEEIEVDASNFVQLQPSKVIFRDKSIKNGLQKGKRYHVKKMQNDTLWLYLDKSLKKSKKCHYYQVEPIEMIPITPKKASKKKNHLTQEDAFHHVITALEFGDTRLLYNNLAEDSQLYSQSKGTTFKGRDAICNYVEHINTDILNSGLFIDVYMCKITQEVTDDSGLSKGDKILICRYSEDNGMSSVQVEINEDHITKIAIKPNTYSFEFMDIVYSRQQKHILNDLDDGALIHTAKLFLSEASLSEEDMIELTKRIDEMERSSLINLIHFCERRINKIYINANDKE